MRILNSFHAPNYIALKEKIFSTKYVIFSNQNDLLNEICFVFLRTYEKHDNITNAIPVRWQSKTRENLVPKNHIKSTIHNTLL